MTSRTGSSCGSVSGARGETGKLEESLQAKTEPGSPRTLTEGFMPLPSQRTTSERGGRVSTQPWKSFGAEELSLFRWTCPGLWTFSDRGTWQKAGRGDENVAASSVLNHPRHNRRVKKNISWHFKNTKQQHTKHGRGSVGRRGGKPEERQPGASGPTTAEQLRR